MSTLIMWYNRFSKNENKAVEAHIPQHQDSKTKKPRHRDSGTKTPWHRETEKNKPQHRDFKTKKPQHWDSKTKMPQHRVPVESWPLCPLIFVVGQVLSISGYIWFGKRNMAVKIRIFILFRYCLLCSLKNHLFCVLPLF